MLSFLVQFGDTEMTAIVGYATDFLASMSPLYLLLISIGIGMIVLTGIVSLIRH